MKSDAIRPTDPATGAPLPTTLPKELRKAFEAMDEDRSGYLSISEFAQVLKKTGAGGAALSADEIELLVHKFDVSAQDAAGFPNPRP